MRNTDKIIKRLNEQKEKPMIVELDQARVLKSGRDDFIIYQSVLVHKKEIDEYVDLNRSKNPGNQHLMAIDIYLKKVGTTDTLTPTYYMWEKDMQKFIKLFTDYIDSTGLDWFVGKATLQVDRKYLEAIRRLTDLLRKKSDLIFVDYSSLDPRSRRKDIWLWTGKVFKV